MNFSVDNLTTERKWRAATGFSQERFNQLVPHFKVAYFRVNGVDMTERGAFIPHEVVIKTEEELLLFTLFSFKANLTYDLLGLVSGMNGSNAKRNQESGITVLKDALAQTGHAPKREFASVAEFETYFQAYETLLVDGTEQRKQRPGNKEAQKDCYSGKKKSMR